MFYVINDGILDQMLLKFDPQDWKWSEVERRKLKVDNFHKSARFSLAEARKAIKKLNKDFDDNDCSVGGLEIFLIENEKTKKRISNFEIVEKNGY